MRKFTAILSLVGILCLISLKGQATHSLGSEIFYKSVGPGVFEATYKTYYDVSAGTTPTPTIGFNLRSSGCSASSVFTGTLQSNATHYINGANSNNCISNNFVKVAIYKVTFALSLSQFSCGELYLSVKDCQKSVVANIPASQNACLYVEATLTPFSTSSPEFLPSNSWVYNLNALATYNNMAILNNAQPDSIAYTLKPAWDDRNVPLNYAPNMSFSQPLPTSSGVVLHPKTGMMTFTPNVFNNSSFGGDNYTVVVEATAFRKINGAMRKVGASQRNLPIFVRNNPANSNPELINVTANGQIVQANGITEIQSGSSLNFQFSTADANAGDNLTLVLPDPNFPGFPSNSTASVTTGSRPTGSLTFNTQAVPSDYLFYFPVSVMDNSCPVRGVTTQVYGVKLLANPLGIKDPTNSSITFTSYPNPFSEGVTFKFGLKAKGANILIYNILGQKIDQIPIRDSGLEEQSLAWDKASEFPAGIYIAKLVTADKMIQTLKFTKL